MANNPINKISGMDDKKILLVFMVAFIAIYVDYSFVIKLQRANLRNIAPKIQKYNSDLNNLSLQLAKAHKEQAKSLQEQEELLSQAKEVISESQIPSLLEDIANTAKATNVELIQMKPLRQSVPAAKEKNARQEKLVPFLINIDLSCGYHELGRFVNQLENKKVFISIEGINIAPQQKDYFKQKVELVLKTYAEK